MVISIAAEMKPNMYRLRQLNVNLLLFRFECVFEFVLLLTPYMYYGSIFNQLILHQRLGNQIVDHFCWKHCCHRVIIWREKKNPILITTFIVKSSRVRGRARAHDFFLSRCKQSDRASDSFSLVNRLHPHLTYSKHRTATLSRYDLIYNWFDSHISELQKENTFGKMH